MTVYGYARVSTQKQNIERQIRNILAVDPKATIYKDAFTGRVLARPEFVKLIMRAKTGDTIIFDSVSRMSRNAEEGAELYEELFNRGVNLVFIKEPYCNTATYKEAMERQALTVDTGDAATTKMVNQILQAITDYTLYLAKNQIRMAFEQAEKEVEDLRQRTREGLQTAKDNGKVLGAEKGRTNNVKKAINAKEIIRKHNATFGGTLSDSDTQKLCGISRNSFYKYKGELVREMNATA